MQKPSSSFSCFGGSKHKPSQGSRQGRSVRLAGASSYREEVRQSCRQGNHMSKSSEGKTHLGRLFAFWGCRYVLNLALTRMWERPSAELGQPSMLGAESCDQRISFSQRLVVLQQRVASTLLWSCAAWPIHASILRSISGVQTRMVTLMLGWRSVETDVGTAIRAAPARSTRGPGILTI